MAVRVLDSKARRSGFPGKKTAAYIVDKYGGMRLATDPMGLMVYRSVAQSISSPGWNYVEFDTAKFPPAAYGLPVMWTSGHTVSIRESGWYVMSASIQFEPINRYNIFVLFRFTTLSGLTLPGGQTYVPNQYSFPISGDMVYYLNAGDGVQLQVAQMLGSPMNLYAGFECSGLTIGRLRS